MKDTRDLRDPQAIGEAIFRYRRSHPNDFRKLSEILNDESLDEDGIPDVAPDVSTCTLTQQEYKTQLADAAVLGDRYSRRRLEEILQDEDELYWRLDGADRRKAAESRLPQENARVNESAQSKEFLERAKERLRHVQDDVVIEADDPGDADGFR